MSIYDYSYVKKISESVYDDFLDFIAACKYDISTSIYIIAALLFEKGIKIFLKKEAMLDLFFEKDPNLTQMCLSYSNKECMDFVRENISINYDLVAYIRDGSNSKKHDIENRKNILFDKTTIAIEVFKLFVFLNNKYEEVKVEEPKGDFLNDIINIEKNDFTKPQIEDKILKKQEESKEIIQYTNEQKEVAKKIIQVWNSIYSFKYNYLNVELFKNRLRKVIKYPFVIKKASDSVSKIEIPYLNIDIMMRFKYYENGVLKCVKSQKALELMLIKLYNIIGENPPFSYDIVNDIVVIKHPKINAKKPINISSYPLNAKSRKKMYRFLNHYEIYVPKEFAESQKEKIEIILNDWGSFKKEYNITDGGWAISSELLDEFFEKEKNVIPSFRINKNGLLYTLACDELDVLISQVFEGEVSTISKKGRVKYYAPTKDVPCLIFLVYLYSKVYNGVELTSLVRFGNFIYTNNL